MRYLLIILLSVLFLSGCGTPAVQEEPTGKLKRYELRGEVISTDKLNRTASIKHEEIPEFMQGMTMSFNIKEDWVWDDLKPGAGIKAELVVDNANGKSWLEKISITSAPTADQSPLPVKDDGAVEGKHIVDFKLTNQDNIEISPKDFKEKAWALTFIYAQCPLPDFCIAMSKNFSDLANRIAEDDSLKDKVRLLSISFDPKRDTPEKLKMYGLGYLGRDSKAKDFKIWQLAVGADAEVKKIADFFGLRFEVDEKDKTQFRHSLRTAVISPEGKVTRVITGSRWKPDRLLSELKATLQTGNK